MRIVLQRVTRAGVTVDGQPVANIGLGVALLVAAGPDDTPAVVDRMADKIVHLRVFNDEQGRFNRSLLDVGGGALVVSQFTLYADSRRGRRPNFSHAQKPELARPLIDRLADQVTALGIHPVATGRFAAHMQVEIHNDGPVTIWLDSADWSTG